MKHPLVVAVAVAACAAVSPVSAEERRPEPLEVTRKMVEGLRTGTVDAAAAAEITRWILHEKHEVVARSLVEVLRSVDLAGGGQEAERWTETARAMAGLFESALTHAAERRPRDTAGWRELQAVVSAAGPAVADALRESDPAARASLKAILGVAAPSLPGMAAPLAQALGHESAEVRQGAAALLGAMGAAGRPALSALRRAQQDPDAGVRAVAAEAVRRIESSPR
jgi:hypothetical protein